eukprot:TRINITY_DN11441_c0_g2_i16.p1 TRINITY_DN11441_c0_g2~~TRINITY_DN11441_c0_g2_i16.p1  ORF type:complete len:367 (-),score=121.44 TRINITY_DN11441_c0_g2_i16:522-1622(-)
MLFFFFFFFQAEDGIRDAQESRGLGDVYKRQFFTSACYSRYNSQYINLKQIEGHLRNIGIMVRTLTKDQKDRKLVQFEMMELFRYLCAAYYLLFVRLYDGETHVFNIDSALENGLVTYEERNELLDMSQGMRWFKYVAWAYEHADEMGDKFELEKEDMGPFLGQILLVRETMNQVTYTYQMPVPFAYYHIISFLTVTVCVLWTFALASDTGINSWIAVFPWLVVMFGYLGMREVAIQMAEPFGDDDCDLPVDNYVTNVMKFMTIFLEDRNGTGRKAAGRATFHKEEYWAEARGQPQPGLDVREVLKTGLTLQGHKIKSGTISLLVQKYDPLRWGFVEWSLGVHVNTRWTGARIGGSPTAHHRKKRL